MPLRSDVIGMSAQFDRISPVKVQPHFAYVGTRAIEFQRPLSPFTHRCTDGRIVLRNQALTSAVLNPELVLGDQGTGTTAQQPAPFNKFELLHCDFVSCTRWLEHGSRAFAQTVILGLADFGD